ncbi:MAG: FMN-binding protein [Planctomycetota bacterium]|jgi:electron transport complex protein RnfG
MLRIKHFIQQSWLLIVAAFSFGLLIAVTNAAWAPRIEQNKIEKMNRLMSSLLPDANSFEPITQLQIASARGKKINANIYSALSKQGNCIGWTFNTLGPGFADKIELIIAVDRTFEQIAGFDVVSSNETPGFGDQIKLPYYRNQFRGIAVDRLKLEKSGEPKKMDTEIIAISGATVSSQAVVDIINNSLLQVRDQMREKGLLTNGK